MAHSPELQIILPVYNEAGSIEKTILEIFTALSPVVDAEFIVSEDGSTDGTKEILVDLATKVPMRLIAEDQRKGYSLAMIDAFKAVAAPYTLCLDSDGQCSPTDFWRFWKMRDEADIIIGWRRDRADSGFRMVMSRTFGTLHKILFRVPIHDPSCPYLLIRRRVIERITPSLGLLRQGFWWEFTARAHKCGFRIVETPIEHRLREVGGTRVYNATKLPGIVGSHLFGLLSLWRQTRRNSA